MSTTEDLLRGTLHEKVAGRTANPDVLVAGTMTRYRRRRRRSLLASIVAIVLAAAASAGSFATVQVADRPAPSYPLPTTGSPDGPYHTVPIHGEFRVWMTPDGACAAIGPQNMAFLWPKGYRVRLDPVQLLDDHGKVVAKGGKFITAAGGSPPSSTPNRCAAPRQQTFAIESRVWKGR